MTVNFEHGVLSRDRHPSLRRYAIKYLYSVCILAYCRLGKRTPGFWDNNTASFFPKEAQHILVCGSCDQETLSDAENSDGACSQTTMWKPWEQLQQFSWKH